MIKLAEAVRLAKLAKPDHARKFAQHMIPHVVRPAQIIWNRAIGAVFLLFAVSCFSNAYMHSDNQVSLALSLFLGAVMASFGLGSFWKARRLSRLQNSRS